MENILNLLNWTILETKISDTHYQIVAAYQDVRQCPRCGSQDEQIQRFGKRKQIFLDLPIHGKQVGILVQRQRYRCTHCHHLYHQPLPDMDEQRQMTRRLVQYIGEQSLQRTFVSIAHEVGVDEKTIRNVFQSHAAKIAWLSPYDTPRWLGIDELMLMKKLRGILTNIERRTVLDVLPSRTQATVRRALLEMPERKRVELVCMDMWGPFRDAVRVTLPQAQIIVDKFHVVRMANQAVEAARKAVRGALSERQRRTLMHDRFVLLRRQHDLTEHDQLILEAWTQAFPLLGQAYHLKEAFYRIWDATDPTEARQRYADWRHQLPNDLADAFKPLTTAMGNWHQEIFAYFAVPGAAATNAVTESLNGLAKLVARTGRGYAFDAIRTKMLFADRDQGASTSLRRRITHAPSRNSEAIITEIERLVRQHEHIQHLQQQVVREQSEADPGIRVADQPLDSQCDDAEK